ncbi:MAG: thymidine phosphorylase [Bacteroidetes bacterium]|nr:thymidine phosphorylase [Rhodothermia bacterium]MCS7155295.1 thymidine phosphorylase [Bacteroidota bacterium]MCX7907880.1 thymidine phosphorylase [Bacteroidota bacterium]MDW8138699.1 thymidine phosphorylase [Bacteroidota bacterium]MDW8284715.1 thymidine phosphorylase [Bacteroidota bacterium]
MRFTPVEIIAKKRDRKRLSREEIRFFVHGLLDGTVRDYQAAAWLMAVYLNGLDAEETLALTEAMLHSGRVMDLSAVPGIKVDKHSTGGVGDKVTLLLVPIVAAAGVPVPTISGRGLGHTGGTLDKLESIPGFRTHLAPEAYERQLREIGAVMIGQTEEIAPADRELYALRDVTATVESIPLIAASIMSKKLAEGIDALVLDVKVGRGAFMKTRERARELAQTLVAIGRGAGKRTAALLTDMDTPLGRTIGNWLEVEEAIECLRGAQGAPDLLEVTYELAAWMFWLAERVLSLEEGRRLAQEMLQSGQAFAKFRQIVQAQGGDVRYVEEPERYPRATQQTALRAPRSGYVVDLDAWAFAWAALELGAGRYRKEEAIDPTAGIRLNCGLGAYVQAGDPVAVLYAATPERLERALARLREAVRIADAPPEPRSRLLEVIS